MSRKRPKKAAVAEVAAVRAKPLRPTDKDMARRIFFKEVCVCPVCNHPLIPVSDKRWVCPYEQHTKLISSHTLQGKLYERMIPKRTGNKVHLSVPYLHTDCQSTPIAVRLTLRDAPYPPPPERKPRKKKETAAATE